MFPLKENCLEIFFASYEEQYYEFVIVKTWLGLYFTSEKNQEWLNKKKFNEVSCVRKRGYR